MNSGGSIQKYRAAVSGEKVSQLADDILHSQFKKIKKCQKAILKKFGTEAVHDMRVAIRRLLVALNVFKNIIPKHSAHNKEYLKKLRDLLGERRDLDIFEEFLGDKVPTKIVNRMESLKKKLLLMLKSKRHEGSMDFLENLKTESKKIPCSTWGKREINKSVKKVLKFKSLTDENIPDETLHKLRIANKKLRYLCEFLESRLSLESIIGISKQVQDILGELQDCIIGMDILEKYKKEFPQKTYKKIKEDYELKKKTNRASFFELWPTFSKQLENFV